MSTDIFNDYTSESDAYEEEYSLNETQFKEKKKHLKENKVFLRNVLTEYIDAHRELFTTSIIEQENNQYDNDTNNNETNDNDTNNNETNNNETNDDEEFEDVDSEIVDNLIEFEYQKCLGVLNLIFDFCDTKNIDYDRDFLVEKMRGYTIVLKPYCLNHHNYLGYLKNKRWRAKISKWYFY